MPRTLKKSSEREDASSSTNSNILQAMDRITNCIMKAIDTKVDTVLVAIRDQRTQIQALGVQVGKPEGRMASVETIMVLLQSSDCK